MPLFGAHKSIAGGYYLAVHAAQAHGCETVQLFTKAPNQWAAKPILPEAARLFRKALRAARLRKPLAHDCYLINLASPDSLLYRRSIEAFVDEVQRAEQLGLSYLVTHPGAHMGEGDETGLKRVVAALDEVHRRTPAVRIKVLLETTAGMGTSLGHRFEHLAYILKNVEQPRRLGVCLDTCHVVAAGYALWPATEYDATMRSFNTLIGLKRLRAFHVNDSLKPLGSRVDRHAHVGQGHVGIESFRLLVNDPRFQDRPMILETPKESADNADMDAVNLATLRGLVGSRARSPAS